MLANVWNNPNSSPTGWIPPIKLVKFVFTFDRSTSGKFITAAPKQVGGAKSPCPTSASINNGLKPWLINIFAKYNERVDLPELQGPIIMILFFSCFNTFLTRSFQIEIPNFLWCLMVSWLWWFQLFPLIIDRVELSFFSTGMILLLSHPMHSFLHLTPNMLHSPLSQVGTGPFISTVFNIPFWYLHVILFI